MFAKKKEAPAPLALTPLDRTPHDQARVAAPQIHQPVAPPARPKPVSMFAQGLTVRGDIVGDVEVHLDCAVLGDVKVGKLIIGPNARVEGSVISQAMEIHGQVIGSVTAQSVRLYGTARVDGDITHEQLAMETGAEFQGRSLKFRRPAPSQPQPQAHAQPQPPQTAPTAPPSASQTPYSHVAH
ncbi:polymer-forming cytoskeletal protein [Caulobacter sp. 1776]|uniref:bactofilin family protein n=1 Tax=Caulobacter sp. 1776 TaxID=3156420 RepID=UPI003392A599